ncbi:E3 ubiquitin-protein ligase WAV3 [Glycine soja]
MGTGWRRAFCTSDPDNSPIRTKDRTLSPTPSPRSCVSLGFLSTPSLHHHHHHHHQQQPLSSTPKSSTITEPPNDSPRFQTKTHKSNPNSPLSPKLNLSLFRNSFKFRNSCGICSNSVKTGQGTAIYTAECGHAFHFPCVVSHAHIHVCPVCDATWNDVPLLQNDAVVHTEKQNQPSHHHHHRSDSVTSYDDDEPLPSPLTCSTQIAPIPEDEENDDVSEFPGFFVDPKPQSSLRQNNGGDSRSVRVKLMPECPVISVSQSHETRALVLRVKAPPSPPRWRRREPMDLVTVLDVNNSMSGAKFHMLKRAMRLVISSLGPADRLAVVASSANTKRLLPLRRMTAQGQRAARRVVDRLVCDHGNSVGEEAMKKAAKVLEDRRERNPLVRILLLSDGHDENNNKNQRRFLSHMSSSIRFDCIEVPVHSSGFETKKTGLIHEPLEDDFAQYINRTLSVAVHDLRIRLGFSAPAEIRAVYSCSGGPTALSSNSARLGDLYAEEEKELLVEVRVPTSASGTHHVMTVRCVKKDPVSQEFVYGAEHAFTVVPPKSIPICGGRVERLRNVFITSRAVAESRRLAKHNEFSSAHHLLASARALLTQFGSAEEYVRGLEAELTELNWRIQQLRVEREVRLVDESGEVITPTSAWRAAEKLAKMARMKKSLNKVSDLHGFENARF